MLKITLVSVAALTLAGCSTFKPCYPSPNGSCSRTIYNEGAEVQNNGPALGAPAAPAPEPVKPETPAAPAPEPVKPDPPKPDTKPDTKPDHGGGKPDHGGKPDKDKDGPKGDKDKGDKDKGDHGHGHGGHGWR